MEEKVVKESNFYNSIERLEDILQKLESGKESLESALDLYSRGIKIIKNCEKKLEMAEQKMVDISAVSPDVLEKDPKPALSSNAR